MVPVACKTSGKPTKGDVMAGKDSVRELARKALEVGEAAAKKAAPVAKKAGERAAQAAKKAAPVAKKAAPVAKKAGALSQSLERAGKQAKDRRKKL
jgi:hypothetical protein